MYSLLDVTVIMNTKLTNVAVLLLLCQGVISVNLTGCASNQPLEINTLFQPKGDIYSPGFKEKLYPNDLYCTYIIKAPYNYRIKLTFKQFDIEPFPFCTNDMLIIRDGPDIMGHVIGTFCGTEAPNPILTSSNAVHMIFATDYMAGNSGWHIQYETGPDLNLCTPGETQCRNRNCYVSSEKCDGNDNCGDGTDEENCNFPISSTECGINPIAPYNSSVMLDRIMGGREARKGSWPWQADLQFVSHYPNSHLCGGTLINAQWVLTAIHCFYPGFHFGKTAWRIHLGNHQRYFKDEHEQVRYAERLIIYPGYTDEELIGKDNPLDITNDIALIKLNAPVRITDYVRPACIPAQGHQISVNTNCVASGWGITKGTGSDDVLKEVELTVRHDRDCGSESYNPGFVNQTMICVRNLKGLQGVCHGDSGGPLSCKMNNNKWYVMGVASYVTHTNYIAGLCAIPGSGAVYNKVSQKTTWISDMIQQYS